MLTLQFFVFLILTHINIIEVRKNLKHLRVDGTSGDQDVLVQLGGDALESGEFSLLGSDLLLVEGSRLNLTGGLESLDETLVVPAKRGRDITELAELAVGLQADVLQGSGDDDALLQVVRIRDTLESGQVVHGLGALGGLVRDHTADGAGDHLRRGTLMEGTFLGVGGGPLVLEGLPLELVAVQGTRDVDVLAANQSDLLAIDELLGNNGGQATEQVALAINDGFFGEHFD